MKLYINIQKTIKKTCYLSFLLLTSCIHISLQAQQNNCFIKYAVVDMATNPFAADNQPVHGTNINRAHQGLYNDIGFCSEETADKIKISYPHIVYGFNGKTKKPLSSFWAQKKHIAPLNELDDELLDAIPHPHYAQQPTIVLTYPWKEFSVGTRFKHIAEQDTKKTYAIKRIDHTTNTVVYDFIPKKHAIQEIKQDAHDTRKLFVKTINDLVDKVEKSGQNNVIPYVWGGSSFTKPYQDEAFHKKDGTWHRNEKHGTHDGYDCSEFVMRMAKIAGIDFPWKTTSMIERAKRALDSTDELEDGDLIWVPGHVMIVSNIKRNEIIESRAYASGYGCVHRITLEECFDGISTYDDLLHRYYAKEKIKFKNKDGTIAEKTYNFKLLKLIE